uniref:Secreted protein n=1 Tax=Steinernema glaseri TaxID=37863 RepID=A0A1I8AD19_9BILA
MFNLLSRHFSTFVLFAFCAPEPLLSIITASDMGARSSAPGASIIGDVRHLVVVLSRPCLNPMGKRCVRSGRTSRSDRLALGPFFLTPCQQRLHPNPNRRHLFGQWRRACLETGSGDRFVVPPPQPADTKIATHGVNSSCPRAAFYVIGYAVGERDEFERVTVGRTDTWQNHRNCVFLSAI